MERFFSRTKKRSSGCWEWKGRMNKDGYGRFTFRGKDCFAHRVSFFLNYEYWPEEVAHLCENRKCVRPSHLGDLTHPENMAMIRWPNARKTHCPEGHPYDDENTLVDSRGWRKCKICYKATIRRHYDKHLRRPKQAKVGPTEREEILRLHAEGWSKAELGRRYDVVASYIHKILKEGS